MKKRAVAEFSTTPPDTTLPDPKDLPYDPDQWEYLYTLYLVWERLGKRFLPSQIVNEYLNGYGWMLDGLMDMESFADKLREEQRPKNG